MSIVRSPVITAVVTAPDGVPKSAPTGLQRLYDFALKWGRPNLKTLCETWADRKDWVLSGERLDTYMQVLRPPTERFFGQTGEVLLEDDFNDEYLDPTKWDGPHSIMGGTAREIRGRVEFGCPTNNTGGYIKSVNDYVLRGTRLKANLFSNVYVATFISIVPSGEVFSVQNSEGYSIGIWEAGSTKLVIYKNGTRVYGQSSLLSNPEDIEIEVSTDGVIRFYEAGVEVFSDNNYGYNYVPMEIYLWGISWYYEYSNTSYADDFLLETLSEPTLSLAVDKTLGYVGDTFNFSGFYLDAQGNPISGASIILFVNDVNRGSATTGADGTYSIPWVPTAAGTYTVYTESS